jgi:xanthine/uracil permease
MTNFKKNLAIMTPRSWILLACICVFALFMAFVIVPMISGSSGIPDEYVSIIFSVLSFAIAIGCYGALRYINKKDKVKKKNG